MKKWLSSLSAVATGMVVCALLPAAGADAATPVKVSSNVPSTLSASMPIVRLNFNAPIRASKLPRLVVKPALSTKWQQIGPREVQAVATSRLLPLVSYTVMTPATMSCGARCTFTTLRSLTTNMSTNVTWEEQLLAETNYLPLVFTPATSQSDPSQQAPGTFTWHYPNLPTSLSSMWRVGMPNVLVTGALMSFQVVNNLPTTGVADPTTWNDLIDAAQSGKVDPNPYNYVTVSEGLPETVTLYVGGVARFHTLANTGISVAPTSLGTYPVYLRYATQTMSGTNPDGSHYSDSGIPWISYFNGGEALHGFIRYTYGWPQSLGCVEMPFASAQTIWPHTPIGTLVTVLA